MGCPSENTLAALLGGELSAEQAGALQAHAADCADCGELMIELAAAFDEKTWRARTAAASSPEPQGPDGQLTGRRLGEFTVLDRLGRGGFGEVYRAEQAGLGREAVIKVLHAALEESAGARARFLREAQLAARLDHPFAAHIYAFGAEADGTCWIAMELVRGTPLDALLRAQGKIALDRFVPFFDRLCEVVHYAHEQGIVHRDLKPANVMVLTRVGRLHPKLLDLGIAKLLGEADGARALRGDDVELTSAGALVGSPPYMAPEQWAVAAVDARTDVYALGALAFEALTGRRAFTGASVQALARAHRAGAPPAGISPAIDAVLARALAVSPADRFASAPAFAAALRSAAGLDGDLESLPRLEPAVRDRALLAAPQPIADAVAVLDAARNAHQARDALSQLAVVVARLIGALALAARSRTGPEHDSARAGELLRALRTSEPDALGWLDLARELCRPFQGRAALHPVPELPALLAGDELTAWIELAQGSTGGSENQVMDQLGRSLPAAARALAALGFLHEHPLVVSRGGFTTRRQGTRRPAWPPARVRDAELAEGHVALLYPDGRPALDMWPVVQAEVAVPRGAEELFVFAGPGRRGARLVALPAGYERDDDAVWGWLGAGQNEPESAAAAQPYRGLLPFTGADSASFFGREREVAAARNRLVDAPLLVVVGPSGAGKSSFAQAGLAPAWPDHRPVVLRPGAHPRFPVARAPALVIVDQLEELVTLCHDAGERLRFAGDLVAALEQPGVLVVLTVRDDFLMRLAELPPLRERMGPALFLLGTPISDDLLRIATLPAERAGFRFERGLAEEMVGEVAGTPGALALLSFTAERLWELRDRHFRLLPRRAYEALGGVGGALARHAEGVLAGMTEAERAAVREAFRRLVTGAGTRRVVARGELEQVMRTAGVLDKLIAARLIVSSESGDVEVVHEALLGAWPRLAEWRREDAEGARLRDELAAAARPWQERGRPRGLLWRGDALEELRLWRRRHAVPLTEAEAAFADASERAETRGRRWRIGLIATAFVALTAGILVLVRLNAAAQRGRAELYEEQGRTALLAGDLPRALENLEAARAIGDSVARRIMAGRAARYREHVRAVMTGHVGFVRSVVFSADGKRVVSAGDDGTVRAWDAESGRALAVMKPGTPQWTVDASPDDHRLVTAGQDGKLYLWDAASGASQAVLTGHGAQVRNVVFAPDGATILSCSLDGTARLWDAASGRERAVLRGHTARIRTCALSPDASLALTAADDGSARIWDLASGAPLAVLAHDDIVFDARWSRDGSAIVTSSADHTARLWHRDGTPRAILRGHTDRVFTAEFDATSARVATGSFDRTVKIWNATAGQIERSLEHQAPVQVVAFSPDGQRLLTTGREGTITLWAPDSGQRLAQLFGHPGLVRTAVFSPDGRSVASTGYGGDVRTWHLGDDDVVVSMAFGGQHQGAWPWPDASRLLVVSTRGIQVTDARGRADWVLERPLTALPGVARDGSRVAIAGDGVVSVWDVKQRKEVARLDQPGVASADLAGELVVSAGGRGVTVRRIDGSVVEAHREPADFAEIDRTGRYLVAADGDTLRLRDRRSGSVLVLRGHAAVVLAAEFDAAGRRLATASGDGTIRIWRTADGVVEHTLSGHAGAVNDVDFSTDGAFLVTAGEDFSARLWEVETGKLVGAFTGQTPMVSAKFASDGRLVTDFMDGRVTVWRSGL